MLEQEKVWVIGSDSFTGKYLCPILTEAGYLVEASKVDICNALQVKQLMLQIKPDYIVNLAGISFVPDGKNERIYAVNTLAPQNILDACMELPKKPKRIILASSSHVYGDASTEKIKENNSLEPINHYGCSKLAMEKIANTYRQALNITIVRPFNYTGVGQQDKFLVPKIVAHFKQRKGSISLGNIDIWRDISDVRWVVKAYASLLHSKEKQLQTINLCSGELTSIRMMINMLQEMTGHTIKIQINESFVRANDVIKQCGDVSLLQEAIAMPTVNIYDTLKWMLKKTSVS